MLPLVPLNVAVTVAVPAPTALSAPPLTVTTEVLLEDHVAVDVTFSLY